jgi:hypothetical protein
MRIDDEAFVRLNLRLTLAGDAQPLARTIVAFEHGAAEEPAAGGIALAEKSKRIDERLRRHDCRDGAAVVVGLGVVVIFHLVTYSDEMLFVRLASPVAPAEFVSMRS